MAEIQIFCTHCDYRFTVSSGLAGTTINCPHCKEDFVVHAPSTPPMERTTNRPAAIAALAVLVIVLILLIWGAFNGKSRKNNLLQTPPSSPAASVEVRTP